LRRILVKERAMHILSGALGLLGLVGAAGAAHAACFDVARSEPRQLAGVLLEGSAQNSGLSYVLELEAPICLTGEPGVDPNARIAEVQVFATEKTRDSFRSLVNSKVVIDLAPREPGQPLVLRVARIAAAAESVGASAAVTGFYRALGRGNGEEAANFVVPESRSGPLSGDGMSRFYGDLVSPLELISVEPDGPGAFIARYSFRSSSGACNGRAIVKTVSRDGVDLISSIRALDGC
jgi:hypothetical protein